MKFSTAGGMRRSECGLGFIGAFGGKYVNSFTVRRELILFSGTRKTSSDVERGNYVANVMEICANEVLFFDETRDNKNTDNVIDFIRDNVCHIHCSFILSGHGVAFICYGNVSILWRVFLRIFRFCIITLGRSEISKKYRAYNRLNIAINIYYNFFNWYSLTHIRV